MGKILFLIYFCSLSLLQLNASALDKDSVFTYTFHDSLTAQSVLLKDIDILPDYDGVLDIDRILGDSSLTFQSIETTSIAHTPRYVWARVRLKNNTSNKVNELFAACSSSDSFWMYSVKINQVISAQFVHSGQNVYSKPIPVYHNYFSFSLDPMEEKTYYFKTKFFNNTQSYHYNHYRIRPAQEILGDLFQRNNTQFLYAGMMLLLGTISLFLFLPFKEKAFIFFGLLVFCFILYFLEVNNILANYILFNPNSRISMLQVFISGIVLFMGFFISSFLELKKQLPKINTAYLGITVFVTFFSHVIFTFTDLPGKLIITIHNGLILLFVISTMVPVVLLTRKKVKSGRILMYSLLIMFIGSVVYQLSLLNILPAGDWAQNSFQFGTLAFSSFLFYGLFDKITGIQNERIRIKAEKDKTDELLLNILPAEVAEELKEKGYTDARDFEMVSILFTDFKEFTQTSELLTAQELVEEINTCFKAFDGICEKYDIEKIKTIGDAYMAAGGLPVPKEDSIKNTICAALEMQEFIHDRRIENAAHNKPAFQMRIGVHTGPVVAGIVGVKKFQYDIWGDTVNTAARIESAGESGKVNISLETYQLIKDEADFEFEHRGKIEAKGKGEIDMYFVKVRDNT